MFSIHDFGMKPVYDRRHVDALIDIDNTPIIAARRPEKRVFFKKAKMMKQKRYGVGGKRF